MNRETATLYIKDYATIVLSLRELALIKHEQLVKENASDLQWKEVDNLYRIASTLEVELNEAFK